MLSRYPICPRSTGDAGTSVRVVYTLSDTVTDDDRTEYGGLAIKILDLLTLWDRLLDNLYWVAAEWVTEDRSREKYLHEGKLRLRRDDDAARDFLSLSRESEASGDRSLFLNVFRRVQQTRHHIAHASAMNAMRQDGVAAIGIPYYADNKRVRSLDGGRSTVTMALVRKRLRDLEWLLHHVDWVRGELHQLGGPLATDRAPDDLPPRQPANLR
jgi:hypothetical protein